VAQTADVIVIGSGGFGAATAYALARRGRRVTVLDRYAIASQTSPRAAGIAATVRTTDLMTSLANRAVRSLIEFADETGVDLGIVKPGSIKIAREERDLARLHLDVEMGRRHALGIELITAADVARLNPLVDPAGIVAAALIPTDLYFEPSQVAISFATAAAGLGARLVPNNPVTGVRVTGGRVVGVDTLQGPFDAPIVIDAAGAWAASVAALAGYSVPVVPMRHQLVITEPLAGVRADLPILRIIDAGVYVRASWGGLLVGGYETTPLAIDMAAQPAGFEIGDTPLDLAVIRGLIDLVVPQLPILRGASFRVHRGGVPTLTVDGQHVVGEVPGAQGMFVAAGCNVSGLSMSPAIGQVLAEWVVDGAPSVDLSPMSITRFGSEWADEARVQAAARHQYASFYRATI
jgi:glycine/D-amino acid oxidase-like deaminating enzyme